MSADRFLIEAEVLHGYTVRLSFEDGITGEVDLSYLLGWGGLFDALRDVDYFCQLQAAFEKRTIVWPNGAEVPPHMLYEDARLAAVEAAMREDRVDDLIRRYR